MENKKFEIGKYYKHSGGRMIHILCEAKTTVYGITLVAEEVGNENLIPVGKSKDNAINWEIAKKEEWLKNFSN